MVLTFNRLLLATSVLVGGSAWAYQPAEGTDKSDATVAELADGVVIPSWQEPLTGMEFVEIAGGCFEMGSDRRERPQNYVFFERIGVDVVMADDESPAHKVCVDDFAIGKYEVTESQWQRLMPAISVSDLKGGAAEKAGLPQRNVSWQQAMEFGRRLSERSGSDYRFRLPSEAEWEYACSAGMGWEKIREVINLNRVARYGKHEVMEVGSFKANPFGVFDLLGNVWEWTLSPYRPYSEGAHLLPTVAFSAEESFPEAQRVMRGGSFRARTQHIGCTRRGHGYVSEAGRTVGLRLVRIKQ